MTNSLLIYIYILYYNNKLYEKAPIGERYNKIGSAMDGSDYLFVIYWLVYLWKRQTIFFKIRYISAVKLLEFISKIILIVCPKLLLENHISILFQMVFGLLGKTGIVIFRLHLELENFIKKIKVRNIF